jgi:hypothetical protein
VKNKANRKTLAIDIIVSIVSGLAALVFGFIGVSLLFSDLGTNETTTGRLITTIAFFLLASLEAPILRRSNILRLRLLRHSPGLFWGELWGKDDLSAGFSTVFFVARTRKISYKTLHSFAENRSIIRISILVAEFYNVIESNS